jgi:hypothetical protein
MESGEAHNRTDPTADEEMRQRIREVTRHAIETVIREFSLRLAATDHALHKERLDGLRACLDLFAEDGIGTGSHNIKSRPKAAQSMLRQVAFAYSDAVEGRTISHEQAMELATFEVAPLKDHVFSRDVERAIAVVRSRSPEKVSDLEQFLAKFDLSDPDTTLTDSDIDAIAYALEDAMGKGSAVYLTARGIRRPFRPSEGDSFMPSSHYRSWREMEATTKAVALASKLLGYQRLSSEELSMKVAEIVRTHPELRRHYPVDFRDQRDEDQSQLQAERDRSMDH